MTKIGVLLLTLILGVFALGCGSGEKAEEGAGAAQSENAQQAQGEGQAQEPEIIAVQHILIGFEGSLPGKPVSRTQQEAESLAAEILSKARGGEDFDALVKQYTDDAYPGVYRMANFGVTADLSQGVYSRGGMVPAFGNVGFKLGVGEIGMAPYDEQQSPYGWHIIKRVE